MKQEEVIQSLIPQELIAPVPEDKKEHVIGNVVKFFARERTELYEEIRETDDLSDELRETIVREITEFINMVRQKHQN